MPEHKHGMKPPTNYGTASPIGIIYMNLIELQKAGAIPRSWFVTTDPDITNGKGRRWVIDSRMYTTREIRAFIDGAELGLLKRY